MCGRQQHSYTHQILGQQGGTGEDGHIHLADWTLSLYLCRQHDKIIMWPTATHQTLGQQGGPGEDSDIHLADWTLSVVGTSADIMTKLRGQQLHTRLYGSKKEPEKTAVFNNNNNNNIHLADWTFSVAAIEKKKRTRVTYVALFLTLALSQQKYFT